MTTDGSSEDRPASKVARLINEYELGEEFGAQLESHWTASKDERLSLRTLADRFNKELLATVLANEGVSTIDGELSNLYRVLTDDDVSSGARTEVRARLNRNGIDVDTLDRDFVTYQAIRTYLTEYRGAEYNSKSDDDRLESTVNSVQRLKSRLESVVFSSIESLRAAEALTIGEFTIFVSVDVFCTDCDNQYGAIDLFRRGGCECEDTESQE